MKGSVQRFRQIVTILAYYGFGYVVNSKLKKEENLPINLRHAFEELGPTFIKIGQILSTRPDLLPDEYIKELSKLQDRVPPEAFSDINNEFKEEFNDDIENVFLHFNKIPDACASVAQVHSAVLKDGTKVVVKIQRPHIQEKMQMDLAILLKIANITKAHFADAIIDPVGAIEELIQSTKEELNFKNETANIKKFKKNNSKVAFLSCPYLIDNLCSKKIITMEKIDGFKITDIDALNEGGYELYDVAKKLALSYFKQVFTDGFFHGDPHPGNILIREGKICFIDFGIMGNLSNSIKTALNEAIEAVAMRDIDRVISVLMSIGIKKGYINRNKLYDDIDYLFDCYLNTSLQNIKVSTMLQEVFEAANRNNLSLPRDLTLLIRGMVIIEGVVSKIDPEIRILDIAIPFVKANSKSSITDNLNMNELLINSYNFIKSSSKLPSKLIELSNSILNGRAKFQLQISNLNKTINDLNKMTNRIVFALIVSSLIMGSSMLLNTGVGPKFYGISLIGITGYAIAAFMGLALIISIAKSGKM